MTRPSGALLALFAALLFGVGTPLVKLWFGPVKPLLLAALLNLGAAFGVALLTRIPWRFGRLAARRNRLFFAGSLLSGGMLAPVLLVWGIAHAPGSAAALLLNLEAAFTALIAWIFFREPAGGRFAAGIGLVTLGGIILSLREGSGPSYLPAGLALAGACLCWAIDTNCTARLRGVPPAQFSLWKNLLAGIALLVAAAATGLPPLDWTTAGQAVMVGACCHGLALLVFVMAIQRLGAGRTAAYFATAPFVGAAASVLLLGDPVTPHLLAAAALMAAGIFALMTERHPPVSLPE